MKVMRIYYILPLYNDFSQYEGKNIIYKKHLRRQLQSHMKLKIARRKLYLRFYL